MARARLHRSVWLSAVALLPAAWAAWPHTVDDAFITARYATRLFAGDGYTFNDGVVSDGVTGPSWIVPMWMGALWGRPVLAAKLAGVVAMSLSVGWVVARARGCCTGKLASGLLLATCAGSLPLAVWSVAGLETGLATLCATAMVLGATRRPRPSGLAVGLAVAVGAWTRPELALLAAGSLAYCLARDRLAGVRALWLSSASACALLLFRMGMFGHWLPLSALAKAPRLDVGVSYVVRSWPGMLGPPAAVAALWLMLRGRGDTRAWLGLTALHVLAVVLAGGDWMPAARLLVPVLPVTFLALALAAARCIGTRRRGTWGYVAVSLAWIALIALRELPAVRAAGLRRAQQGRRLAALLEPSRGPVALVDVGQVGISLPQRAIVDLAGLTDPEVARMPGGHLGKQLPHGWLHRKAPCQLVVHTTQPPHIDGLGHLRSPAGSPVERRVTGDPWVRGAFRVTDVLRYAPRYHYVILRRADAEAGSDVETCGSWLRDRGVRWHH